jgi:hypothetical protein
MTSTTGPTGKQSCPDWKEGDPLFNLSQERLDIPRQAGTAMPEFTRHLPGGLTIRGKKTGHFCLDFWNFMDFNLAFRT